MSGRVSIRRSVPQDWGGRILKKWLSRPALLTILGNLVGSDFPPVFRHPGQISAGEVQWSPIHGKGPSSLGSLTGDSGPDAFVASGKNAGGLQDGPRYRTLPIGLGVDGRWLIFPHDPSRTACAPSGGLIITHSTLSMGSASWTKGRLPKSQECVFPSFSLSVIASSVAVSSHRSCRAISSFPRHQFLSRRH